MGKSELVNPAVFAEMQAELESLSNTEPGAREVADVVRDLMPLIKGCRDRGHSWKRIAESLQKYHSGLSVGRLRKYAFELDPSLKGKSSSTQSLIPEPVESEHEPEADLDELSAEVEDSEWPLSDPETEPQKPRTKKSAAVDF
ncbi:hypothetical protein [Lyngbya confervoides]|uniref:Uncharacterized protein n=1 Tax=Lyngbya confervoides BDU141951 TaxID=1574623 RepID=A0ABD4T6R7_9CYAN|nr:hypothetical protein [Lyngbya confervoides]MCM1984456.1 hypothetical protein [Lyngbya confervoides BDU141951]